MKKLRKIISVVMIIAFIFLVGCNGDVPNTNDIDNNNLSDENLKNDNDDDVKKEKENVTIAGLKGPTSIGMIKMIDEKSLNDNSYNVEYIQESAPDALTAKIINGDIQISSVPINLASVLYNKSNKAIQIVAVNTVGNLYIVGSDDISNLEELNDKVVGMSGKGSTPDYAMNYIINKNNLSDVELDYNQDHATLAQKVIAGDTKIALLPQPFATQVTMKNEDVKTLIDLNESWKNVTNDESKLYTGCLIINKEFAENNKEFVEKFLLEYENSVKWVLENPEEASQLVEKNEVMQGAKLIEKAIPYCGITYEFASDIKESLDSFYKILFEFNEASVGGSLPDEEFYYTK